MAQRAHRILAHHPLELRLGPGSPSRLVDAGQPANFEGWIDQGGGLARVRYRGASWDARVDGEGDLQPGALLYVKNLEAHTLYVSRQRPA